MELNAVFIHSHIFHYDLQGNVYSEGKLTYEVWKRYLIHFDNLKVLGRFKDGNGKGLNLSSGPSVTHIKLPGLSSVKGRLKNKLETQSIIREHIKNTDLVIVRLPSVHGMIAIDLAKKLNKPYAIELVGDALTSYWYYGSLTGKILAPLYYLKVKEKVSQASYVMYVTKEFLQRTYPAKSAIVQEACSNVELSNQMKFMEFPKKSNEIFKIGLIGSYSSKYKGIENALNVVKRLNQEGTQVELRILGSGNKDNLLKVIKELEIENNVILEGSLPSGEKVFEWLNNLDLYIQPSLTEGLPRALVEAMYCKLPCIASSVGGIPELLNKEYLHKPKDENEIYKKIKKFYFNEELRKEQGIYNFNKAAQYTKESLDKKRYSFWSKVKINLKENKI